MNTLCLVLSLTVPHVFSADLVPVFIWDSFRDTSTKFSNIPVLSEVNKGEFRGILNEKLQDNHVVLVFAEENLSIEDLSWQDESGHGAFPNLRNLSRSGEADLLYLPFVDSPLNVLEHMFPATQTVWNEASLGPDGVPILSEDTPYSNYLRVNLEDAKDNDDRPDLLKRHDSTISDIYKNMRQKHNHVVAIYTAHHSSWHVEEGVKSRRARGAKESSEKTRRADEDEAEKNETLNAVKDMEREKTKNEGNDEDHRAMDEKKVTTDVPITSEEPITSTELPSSTPSPRPIPEGPPLMTIPILSGLMVSSILLTILAVGIGAMMDIKPTLRFDDPKGKPLTIATSE